MSLLLCKEQGKRIEKTANKQTKEARWIIYPPPFPLIYEAGDEVFIRSKSASWKGVDRTGTIVSRDADRQRKAIHTTATAITSRWLVKIPIMSRKRSTVNESNNNVVAEKMIGRNDGNEKESDGFHINNDNLRKTFDDAKKVESSYVASFRTERLVRRYCDPRTFYNNNADDMETLKNNKDNKAIASDTCTTIIITERTDQYRILALSQLLPTDNVLEIGCSNGECSLVIARCVHKGSLVGFDTSSQMIQEAKDKLRHYDMSRTTFRDIDNDGKNCTKKKEAVVQFHCVDPFTDPKNALHLARVHIPSKSTETTENQQTHMLGQSDEYKDAITCNGGNGGGEGRVVTPNVVFCDIGGNRDIGSVIRMVSWARTSFTPRLVVIKSEEMVEDISALHSSQPCKTKSCEDNPLRKRSKKVQSSSSILGHCDFDVEVEKDGKLRNGETWFNYHLQNEINNGKSVVTMSSVASNDVMSSKCKPPKYRHPLRAPMALLPSDGKTPICRYHNYHKDGCRKGESCPFDHTVCHWCFTPGHIALHCYGVRDKKGISAI